MKCDAIGDGNLIIDLLVLFEEDVELRGEGKLMEKINKPYTFFKYYYLCMF